MSSNIEFVNIELNRGFLSGFVESSVENPADGRNGECTVHYSGKYSKYEMMVPLVNGMRDGKAMIVNDGVAYLRLEYRRGSLTGVVERMNEYGAIELRGHLVNGVESGFFEEYDGNDNVVWRGYYKNGRRDPESYNRIVRKGKNTVRSIEHGEFYELNENGKVTQLCLYENGVRNRVIATFSGDTMTELDSNGKRIYEGGFKGSVENGFVREGKGRAYAKGGKMVEYLGDWKNGKRNGVGTEYRGLIALFIGEWKNGMRNGKGKEMDESGRIVFVGEWKDGKGKGKEMDANGNVVYEGEWRNGKRNGMGEVLKGTRWMGHWKDGKMNGMGYERDGNGVMKRGCLFENGEMKRVVQEFGGGKMVEYDENGRKVYEGEYKGSVEKGFVREGFGIGFRIVKSNQKSKCGSLKTLFSCCICYRRNELVTSSKREEMVDGMWKDGKYLMVAIPSSLTSNPLGIKKLRIGNRRYNDESVTELKLSGLARLKRIVIGNGCFGKVRVFELDGLSELESVVIGRQSFRIGGNKRSDGSYRIVNCPKLKSIQIGDVSFMDYHSFELNNLPSLQSIDIGKWCFLWAPSFSLTGLIDGLV